MPQHLSHYRNKAEARSTINELVSLGFARNLFSVHDSSDGLPPAAKIAIAIGLGCVVAIIFPDGRLLHLTWHPAMHVIGLISVRMLAGAATGGAVELIFRVASFPSDTTRAHSRFSVRAEADRQTAQAMQLSLAQKREETSRRLLRSVQKYGYEHQSFLSLYDGAEVWFSEELDAAVAYRLSGKAAIVTAAPLAPKENWEPATRAFLEYCAAMKVDCMMLPVGMEYAEVARKCQMGLLRIGESGYFELASWKPAGDRAKKVRAGVNQARHAGITVHPLDPVHDLDATTRSEIDQLCSQWVGTREVDALGWLLELNPFKLSKHKRYFVARNSGGHLVGFLACSPIPARNGWYLEDLIRNGKAERGVSELMVTEALKSLAAEGASLATLGTSPLAGMSESEEYSLLPRLLHIIYEHFDAFYHFKLLHRFKAKFAPSFIDPEFIAYYPPRIRSRMIRAAITVIEPNGITGMAVSKVRKLRRRWLQQIGH